MSRPEIYEFRVTGLLGPVTRAAMPDMDTEDCARETTLMGTTSDTQQISTLLHRLEEAHLITTRMVIVTRSSGRSRRSVATSTASRPEHQAGVTIAPSTAL